MIVRESRRFLRSSPLLSLTGVLLLALGVGSALTAASLLLAFSSPRPPGLRAQAYATFAAGSSQGVALPVSWDRFRKVAAARQGGMRLAAYSQTTAAVLTQNGQSATVHAALVSSGFFSSFAMPLAAGREWTEDETAGQGKTILSDTLARQRFGSPRAAVGQQVLLNGTLYDVTGVADARFHGLFADPADLWVTAHCVVPLVINLPDGVAAPELWRSINFFYILAASNAESPQHLAARIELRRPAHSDTESWLASGQGLSVDWGHDQTLRRWLRLGLGLALALALVSCLNVCLLLVARAPLIAEEVRLKQALGAKRARLAVECAAGPAAMLLTGLLVAIGLWSAALAVVVRLGGAKGQLLLAAAAPLAQALAWQMLLALAVVGAIALVPAWMALGPSGALRTGGAVTANRRTLWWMQVPVVAEIAAAIALSVLAGMIGASLVAMMRLPLGYEPAHRQVVCLAPARGSIVLHSAGGASAQFLALAHVLAEMRAQAGVRAASYVDVAPYDGVNTVDEIRAVGHTTPAAADHYFIASGYFRTIGTHLLRGRDVQEWTRAQAGREVVLNRTLAHDLFPAGDAVGKTVEVTVPARFGLRLWSYSAQVVGIAEDTRPAGYARSAAPAFYEEGHSTSDARPHLIVEGDETPRALAAWSRQAVTTWMPGMAVDRVYSLGEKVDATLAPERRRAEGALAGAAIMAAVAWIGLYGSLAFYLRAKRREMAIRVCLGASLWTIRRMVLLRALRAAAAGAALSLPFWFVLRWLAASEFLGQLVWSPTGAAAITLLSVAGCVLLACLPARAAGAIALAEILREE